MKDYETIFLIFWLSFFLIVIFRLLNEKNENIDTDQNIIKNLEQELRYYYYYLMRKYPYRNRAFYFAVLWAIYAITKYKEKYSEYPTYYLLCLGLSQTIIYTIINDNNEAIHGITLLLLNKSGYKVEKYNEEAIVIYNNVDFNCIEEMIKYFVKDFNEEGEKINLQELKDEMDDRVKKDNKNISEITEKLKGPNIYNIEDLANVIIKKAESIGEEIKNSIYYKKIDTMNIYNSLYGYIIFLTVINVILRKFYKDGKGWNYYNPEKFASRIIKGIVFSKYKSNNELLMFNDKIINDIYNDLKYGESKNQKEDLKKILKNIFIQLDLLLTEYSIQVGEKITLEEKINSKNQLEDVIIKYLNATIDEINELYKEIKYEGLNEIDYF
mgnify:FL=1